MLGDGGTYRGLTSDSDGRNQTVAIRPEAAGGLVNKSVPNGTYFSANPLI
jgi:hypothetical protein